MASVFTLEERAGKSSCKKEFIACVRRELTPRRLDIVCWVFDTSHLDNLPSPVLTRGDVERIQYNSARLFTSSNSYAEGQAQAQEEALKHKGNHEARRTQLACTSISLSK